MADPSSSTDHDNGPTAPNGDKSNRERDHVDYRDLGGPALSLLWSSEPLTGQSLYLGGEVGCDGRIYCIPGHAKRVLVIDPSTDMVYPIGPILPGKYKWLRGIAQGDVVYGLPCSADSVLRIHVPTGEITNLLIPYDEFYQYPEIAKGQREIEWKYHGGTTSPKDGCIYAIPQSAWHVLRIDPLTDICSFVPSIPQGSIQVLWWTCRKTRWSHLWNPPQCNIRLENRSLSGAGSYSARKFRRRTAQVARGCICI